MGTMWGRNNKNKDCPCRECTAPKRHVGCRSECPDWEPWLKVKEEREKAERLRNAAPYVSDERLRKLWKRQRYGTRDKNRRRYDDR